MGLEVSSKIKKRVRVAIPFPLLVERYLPLVLQEGIQPEIGLDHQALDLFPRAEFERVAQVLGEAGIKPTVHAPFCDLSPGAFDALIRRVSLERLHLSLELAQAFQAEVMVFHSGYHPGYHRERYKPWQKFLSQGLEDLVKKAEDLGVPLALENVFEPTPEFLTPVVEAIDSPFLGYCFDPGHALAFAHSSWSPWLKAFQQRLLEIHIHDNDGSWDQHLVPGKGKIPFEEIFTFLREKGLTPALTYEAHREEDVIPGLLYLEGLLF